MNKSSKLYKKALAMYHAGKINKSVALCEKSISSNLNNSSAINLKGLLYYLLGDLKSAKMLWTMNKQENRDSVSEKYLESLKKDTERLNTYRAAVKLMGELKINEALGLFEKCSESDFNLINVSNYRCLCYINKGQYDKAKDCIDKVLEVDRHNKIALDNYRTLIEYGIIKNKTDLRPYIITAVCLVLAVSIYTAGKSLLKPQKAAVNKPSVQTAKTNYGTDKSSGSVQKPQSQQETFPYDEISLYIKNKNYDGLYNDMVKWKDKSLQPSEEALLQKTASILKTDGLNYMYKTGLKLRNSGDNKSARDYFLRAYNVDTGTYLSEHIIYMLGATSESLGDTASQMEYYKQYISKFPKGTYAATVYYSMAMYYKDKDKDLAVSYAEKIKGDFPDSIYYNDKIKALLQQKK